MTEINPIFIVRRAKKQSGNPDAVLWCSDDFETACATLDYLLMKAGYKLKDFFKAIATNFPVVNELPPEGELSLTFCKYYKLDGMDWSQVPGVTLPSPGSEKTVEGTDTTIVDGVDTQTGEVVGDQQQSAAAHVDNEGADDSYIDSEYADDENALFKLAEMPFRIQLLAQYAAEESHVYHISLPHRKALATLEMDTDNHAVQDLILAAENVPDIKKIDMPALWKFTNANKKVFPESKRHELGLRVQFAQLWFKTNAIDRGILTREWAAGNRISDISELNKNDEVTPVPTERYKRAVAQNMANLGIEIALAQLYPDVEPGKFNRAQLTGAKALIERKEDVHVQALKVLGKINDILDYDATSIFGVTRAIKWNGDSTTAELRARVREWFTTNGIYENGEPSRGYPEWEDDQQAASEEISRKDGSPEAPADTITKAAEGIFDATALFQNASINRQKKEVETAGNVQVQEINGDEKSPGNALHSGESGADACEEADTVEDFGVNQNTGNDNQNSDSVNQSEPEVQQPEPALQGEYIPAADGKYYFEPGRYEGIPNEVYHNSNGISSTMLKDVRISPMYYYGRHVVKTIPRVQNDAMIRGTVVHSYVLEPEEFHKQFAIPAEMPKDVVSTSSELVAIIKECNANLPTLMTPDELKAWIEAFNNDLIPPLSLSGSAEETGLLYLSLPEQFQRIPSDQKQTATAQKACIKEYNASLQPMLKVSGTRDQLLDQIATVAPELAAQERAKFIPYNTSGTKEQLTEIVREIRPDVVTADDWHKQQEAASAGKMMISMDMYDQAIRINTALQLDPAASRLLNHPSRQSEVSYFGIDEDTGLEIRVRPDIEIRLPYESICADLKSVSMGYIRQDRLKDRLHREIIERDYHLSAAMYCDVAGLDKFSWIFVNKDEGYHWVAVVEASQMLLELGRKEYRRVLRQINDAMENDDWPAPITEPYTDDLNDFDLSRLKALEEELGA